MFLVFDQSITSQYAKIVAVGYPNYSGYSINPLTMVSGAIGEIVGTIKENNLGEPYYYASVTVDDFPLTGSSTLYGTVIFYGIK